MSHLFFIIYGQPVPYKRTTQNAKWTDEQYHRYQAYKDAIVIAFLEQCQGDWGCDKPLTSVRGQKTRMDIVIYFADYKHGDPSNVHKGIEDALFVNDKFCSGSFDFFYDSLNPRVEVSIS